MSVYPVAFYPNATMDVWHLDSPNYNHGGNVSIDVPVFATTRRNTKDYDIIVVTCPVCGAICKHPISGGAAPMPVQELFLRAYRRTAEVIPGLPARPAGNAGRRPFDTVKTFIADRILARDRDPFRFQLQGLTALTPGD
jgi:hypothetical protein